MKYLRLRYDSEEDTEYDMIVVFERDYKEEKVEAAMRELWNKQKNWSVESWLNYKGLKVKDMIMLNDIELQYIN